MIFFMKNVCMLALCAGALMGCSHVKPEMAADPDATVVSSSRGPAELSATMFARTREICESVENIRGLRFSESVRSEVQGQEAFRAYIKEAVARQFGEAGPDAYIDALVRLGVLKESVDFVDTMLGLLKDQAAAYYDPESKGYYLLMTNAPPMALDIISSHELCHALQDQHFDLHVITSLNRGSSPFAS